MRAVRDADPPFTTARLAVLWALGLRMGPNGSGFASVQTLAADAGVSPETAKRAIRDGRQRGYLLQTRRGHRISDTVVVASEWQLTMPTQGVTGDTLTQTQGVTGDPLERTQGVREPTQGVTGDPPRGPTPRGHQLAARAAAIIANKTGATDAEAAAVVALIERERQPRSITGLVTRLAEDGDLAEWLARVRADGQRADLAAWIASLATQPECPHGVPGGNQLRPDTGQPQCPLCRSQRDRQTASKGPTDPLTRRETP